MSLSQESSAARNHDDRIEHAAQPIAEAMMALTRAVCLLGFSEGKEAVQRVHGLVCEAHEHVRQQHELWPLGFSKLRLNRLLDPRPPVWWQQWGWTAYFPDKRYLELRVHSPCRWRVLRGLDLFLMIQYATAVIPFLARCGQPHLLKWTNTDTGLMDMLHNINSVPCAVRGQ